MYKNNIFGKNIQSDAGKDDGKTKKAAPLLCRCQFFNSEKTIFLMEHPKYM